MESLEPKNITSWKKKKKQLQTGISRVNELEDKAIEIIQYKKGKTKIFIQSYYYVIYLIAYNM